MSKTSATASHSAGRFELRLKDIVRGGFKSKLKEDSGFGQHLAGRP
jgi:hypothetical protein